MIFDLIVKPLIKRMLCLPEEKYVIKARLAMRVEGARGRRLLLPVSLVDVGSYIAAYPLPSESGAISTVAQADGYTIIPENVEFAVEGENVYVNLFSPAYMPSDLYIVGSHDLGLDRLIPLPRDRDHGGLPRLHLEAVNHNAWRAYIAEHLIRYIGEAGRGTS